MNKSEVGLGRCLFQLWFCPSCGLGFACSSQQPHCSKGIQQLLGVRLYQDGLPFLEIHCWQTHHHCLWGISGECHWQPSIYKKCVWWWFPCFYLGWMQQQIGGCIDQSSGECFAHDIFWGPWQRFLGNGLPKIRIQLDVGMVFCRFYWLGIFQRYFWFHLATLFLFTHWSRAFFNSFKSLFAKGCATDQCNLCTISVLLLATVTECYLIFVTSLGNVVDEWLWCSNWKIVSVIWCNVEFNLMSLEGYGVIVKTENYLCFLHRSFWKKKWYIWVNYVCFDFYFAGTNCDWNSGCFNW